MKTFLKMHPRNVLTSIQQKIYNCIEESIVNE